MELRVERLWRKPRYTVGRLFVNGKFFSNTLEDTVRDLPKEAKIYGCTAIPKGRYRVVYNWSPRFGRELPRLLDVPLFSGVLIHCLHPEMEILTEKGWLNLKGFKEYRPEKCWSMNMKSGNMELVSIDKFIVENYTGDLYCCEYPQGTYNNTSYRVTDKHRMLCKMPLAYGSRLDFVEAKDIPQDSSFIACGSTSIKEGVDEQTLVMCKICMHIVADGYVRWYNVKNGERSTISFHYKKERKINRIVSLLKESEVRYSVNKNNDGSTTIRILHPDCERLAELVDPNHLGKNGKCIPPSFLMLPKEQMKQLIEEYHFADGKYTNRKNDDMQYQIASTNVDTLNKLQIMSFLSGYSSSISQENYEKGNVNWKNGYVLSIKVNKPFRTPADSCYIKKPYSGEVFCVQNSNHTIVVRNSLFDVPFVIGNCGNTAEDTSGCILVGKNSEVGRLTQSRYTSDKLNKQIEEAQKHGEEIYIEIVEP